MTTLRQFMLAVAQSPTLADEFEVDPRSVLDRYELSASDRAVLESRDRERLWRALIRERAVPDEKGR
jgi:hypothetical protein